MITRIKFFSAIFLSVIIVCSVTAQHADRKLEKQISALAKEFHGQFGIYVHRLGSNKHISINADSVFPTASMIKVPILIALMEKITNGALQYHQELVYKDSLLYAGVDILGSFKNDEKIELSKLIMLMLTMSDNTASLWLQSLAGTGTRINEMLDSLGLRLTRVNSRTPGREANRAIYGWGQTSPREMAGLFEKIVNGELINSGTSARMLRLLGRNYWDEAAVSQVPADIFVASKGGALDECRNEVLYVHGKGRGYVFCVCTNNNTDQSWSDSNEAWELTRKISNLLWREYGK